MWQELIKVTDDLGRIYEGLSSLGKKKHDALVTVNLPALESLVKEEQRLLNQVAKLEARRRGAVLGISTEKYGDDYALTAADVFSLAPTVEIRDKLTKLHERLTEFVNATQAQNEINSILAQGALNAVEMNLNRLSGSRVEPTYGNSGQNRVTHRRNFDFNA